MSMEFQSTQSPRRKPPDVYPKIRVENRPGAWVTPHYSGEATGLLARAVVQLCGCAVVLSQREQSEPWALAHGHNSTS